MSLFASTIVLASALPSMPSPPIGDEFPVTSKALAPIIFEFSDYGGRNATMRARVTQASLESWCGAWSPNDPTCAQTREIDDRLYEARANCETGDLWTEDRHFTFAGPETENELFYGYITVKDAETGQHVGLSSGERGREFAAMWQTLCPMGWPYKDMAVEETFESDERYGEFMSHNGSTMFHHQKQHIIVYADPKQSIAAVVKPDTVLFRGWTVPNEMISGIAYTFKKGCDPAPYRVFGYDNGAFQLTLRGKAPVREGCKVVGYSDKEPNATLIFDRGE